MRIAINTRLLLHGRLDGIGWFSYETLKRITAAHPEHEFIFLFDRKYSDEFIFEKNVRAEIVRPVTRHPVLWYLWLDWSLPRKLKKWKVDLFVSPDGFIPLRGKLPSVSVIHDINFHHRPGDLPFLTRIYHNYFFPRFAAKAANIGTVSEFSAGDIAREYGINRQKIKVFYNGVNEIFRPLEQKEKEDTLEQYTGGVPYFVFVGGLNPRKNIVNLLKAFDMFREKAGKEFRMIIVGEKMHLTKEIDRTLDAMNHRQDVVFTGRLDPSELLKVTGTASAMCFVPFYEGFGIPVIEAMKCGVPVIASRVTSIPEVGGDAVLYTDPENVAEISEAMIKIESDPDLKKELIARGFERVKKFSWDTTAEKFWELIENTLNGS